MATTTHFDSSGSTSPDPLTLPSSPLGTRAPSRSPTRQQTPSRRSPAKLAAFQSPTKSIYLETGPPGQVSPWRIKVTVQTEPDQRTGTKSPTQQKLARTTKVPLKTNSSSPAKRPRRQPTPRAPSTMVLDIPKPSRKRKATPLRGEESSGKRHSPDPTTDEDAEAGFSKPTAQAHPTGPSPSKRKPKRRSLEKMPTPPSKRLIYARDQLDHALQEAVGYDGQQDDEATTAGAGDLTVSMNEDFTMVSIQSLQSYNKINRSYADLEKSAASITYMPSSPPQKQQIEPVVYPDLSKAMEPAKEPLPVAILDKVVEQPEYDAMSWKVTGPAKSETLVRKEDEQAQRIEQLSAWRKKREAASLERQPTRFAPPPPTVKEPEVQVVTENGEPADESAEEDIWQEEASRSLIEDDVAALPASRRQKEKSRSPTLDDFFADEVVKPRRAKIPRTWRRTSGNDFTYSDSPARDQQQSPAQPSQEKSHPGASRHVSNGSTGGESGRSVVLTPPSTDEDNDQQDKDEDVDTSDLTEPDAAATMLQHKESPLKNVTAGTSAPSRKPESASRRTIATGTADRSESHVEGDTTGFAWRNIARPQRPRAPNLRAMDLSELLNLQSSPAKPPKEDATPKVAPATSPLNVAKRATKFEPVRGLADLNHRNDSLTEVDESYESKAADQRQLLDEVRSVGQRSPYTPQAVQDTTQLSSEQESYEFEDEVGEESESALHHQPSRSYEEHLNIESPQKIQVKFNDSLGNSSLLMPKRSHSSLFGAKSHLEMIQDTLTEDSVTLPQTPIRKKKTTTNPKDDQPGLFNWLTSTIFSALIPQGPTFITPPPEPQTTCPPGFTMHIRSRYGVVPDVHPWTYTHYRTLQRMLNSCTSGRLDSVIPKPGQPGVQLSRRWKDLIGTTQRTFLGEKYHFTEQHALVIVAFFQCTVPSHIVAAIEDGEVAFLGDRSALSHRGTDLRGRRGNQFAFAWCPAIPVPKAGEAIEAQFVLKVLGDCVLANIALPPEVEEREWKKNPIKLFRAPGETDDESEEEEEEEEGDESRTDEDVDENSEEEDDAEDVEMTDDHSSEDEGTLTPAEEE